MTDLKDKPAQKNKGGRPKGRKTKAKPSLVRQFASSDKPREAVQHFINNYIEGGLSGHLAKLHATILSVECPAQRSRLQLQFLEFLLPKLKSVEVSGNVDTTQPIQVIFQAAGTTPQIQNSPVVDAVIEAASSEDEEDRSDSDIE